MCDLSATSPDPEFKKVKPFLFSEQFEKGTQGFPGGSLTKGGVLAAKVGLSLGGHLLANGGDDDGMAMIGRVLVTKVRAEIRYYRSSARLSRPVAVLTPSRDSRCGHTYTPARRSE